MALSTTLLICRMKCSSSAKLGRPGDNEVLLTLGLDNKTAIVGLAELKKVDRLEQGAV